MFRTDDNYNLYYDGLISDEQETNFKTLIVQHQIPTEFAALLKRDYNFKISNTYDEHRKLIWILYKILGLFAISALFAEEAHPPGCEYEAKVDFYIEANGNFEYELKNNLFLYEDYGSSDECKDRIARKSIGFDKNYRIRGNMGEMDLDDFVKKITAK
ncbi:MAG: hypothetical protein JSU80_02560 [Deltaproteobacteria bacterium]|nr:MAG: hypothetical protein JSU80_02560 [Deltaproteobacteria bacterium]